MHTHARHVPWFLWIFLGPLWLGYAFFVWPFVALARALSGRSRRRGSHAHSHAYAYASARVYYQPPRLPYDPDPPTMPIPVRQPGSLTHAQPGTWEYRLGRAIGHGAGRTLH